MSFLLFLLVLFGGVALIIVAGKYFGMVDKSLDQQEKILKAKEQNKDK